MTEHPMQQQVRDYALRLEEGVNRGELDRDLALASIASDALAWSLHAEQRGDQLGAAISFEAAANAARERWMSLQERATPVPDTPEGLD